MRYKKWLERHRFEFALIHDKKRRSVREKDNPGEDEPQEQKREPPKR